MAKRIFDICFGTALLIILLPVFAALAIWIKLDSPGPVLFRQKRLGRFGRLFDIYKFRSMFAGGRDAGPNVTASDDPRVTRAGRKLRYYKLDELPQLINIVRGDMSFVGPRPEVPQYAAHWTPSDQEIILSVRPGLTDPATIKFYNEEQILGSADDPEQYYIGHVLPAKAALYRRYVETQTLAGDLNLLTKTVTRIYKSPEP